MKTRDTKPETKIYGSDYGGAARRHRGHRGSNQCCEWKAYGKPGPDIASSDGSDRRRAPTAAQAAHHARNEELPAGRAPREDFSALELSNFVTVRVDEQGEVTQWFGDRTNLYADEDIRATASQGA